MVLRWKGAFPALNHVWLESAGERLKHYGVVVLALRIILLQLDVQPGLPELAAEVRDTALAG